MATEIQEGNQLFGVSCNVRPRLVLSGVGAFMLDLLGLIIETHNLLSDGRGTTICGLVREVEDLGSC